MTESSEGAAPVEPAITVEYTWSQAEFLRAHRAHFRRSFGYRFRILLLAVMALVLLLYTLIFVLDQRFLRTETLVLLTFGALFVLAGPLLTRLILIMQYRKRPDKDILVSWRITPERLNVQSAHGQSEFTWEALVLVARTPEGFLLYPIPQIFHWLPMDGFADAAAVEAFAEIAAKKAKKYTVVK